ncbi:hypothetical protein T484DRAFT_1753848 [Baffinella frigidus]|nr:hypothetical protein T484DRAFT_1753848 [Cryptophyta sp. CCMP2293]
MSPRTGSTRSTATARHAVSKQPAHTSPTLARERTRDSTLAAITLIQKKCAVEVIARVFTRKLCKRASSTAMTIAIADKLTYAALSIQVLAAKTTLGTAKLLRRVCAIATTTTSPVAHSLTNVTNTRKFMSIFMVLHNNGRNWFELIGSSEKTLLIAARMLMQEFERLRTEALPDASTAPVVTTFATLLANYYDVFDMWNRQDALKQLRHLEIVMGTLYETEEYLTDLCPDTLPLRTRLRAQRHVIRMRMSTIATDVAQLEKTETRLMLQRSARFEQRSMPAMQGDTLLPMESYSPASACQQSAESAKGLNYETVSLSISNAIKSMSPADLLLPKPRNIHVVYELLLHPTFFIGCDMTHSPKIDKMIKVVNRITIRVLRDELASTPRCFTHFISLMRSIQSFIAGLRVSSVWSKALQPSICRLLDMDFITQQIEDGCFNGSSCCKLVRDIVAVFDMHAPTYVAHRTRVPGAWTTIDKEITTAFATDSPDKDAQALAICHAINFVRHLVDGVYNATENTVVEETRSFAKNHGVASMRQVITDRIDLGEIKFDTTNDWLRRTMCSDDGQWMHMYNSSKEPQRIQAVSRLVSMGIVAMVCKPNTCYATDAATMPETLGWDFERIRCSRQKFNQLVTVSTISYLVAEWARSKGLRETTLCHVAQPLTSSILKWEDVPGLVSAAMAIVRSQMQGFEEADYNRLHSRLMANLSNANDPVVELFTKRIRRVLLFNINTSSDTSQPVRGSTDDLFGGPVSKHVISVISPLVQGMSACIHRMSAINTVVFAEHYNRMVLRNVTNFYVDQISCHSSSLSHRQ